MSTLLYIEIDIIGMIILLLMLFHLKKKLVWQMRLDEKLFSYLIIINLAILFFDATMWILDGMDFAFIRPVFHFASISYFVLNPFICFMWLIYSDYKIFGNLDRLRKRAWIYSIPFMVNTFLTVLSPFTKWIYYLDEANHYHRGNLFILLLFLSFLYLLYAGVIAVWGASEKDGVEEKELLHYLVLFPVIPFAGSVAQAVFPSLATVWVATVIALLIIFMNIQNSQIYTDTLTGLYNRRHFGQHLDWKIRSFYSGFLFVILIDVDRFKEINDKYGHLVGDIALTQVADILKISCDEKVDFVARFGGDEFVIIGERDHVEGVHRTIEEIGLNAQKYNEKGTFAYKISLSCGYAIYGEKGVQTADTLLALADQRMYEIKEKKKAMEAEHV